MQDTTKLEIQQQLNKLHELQQEISTLQKERDEKKEAALTPKVRKAIRMAEAHYDGQLSARYSIKLELEASIKHQVIENAETVKGDYLQAIYVKGRTTWNTDALEGYSIDHPQILQFRRKGSPTVTFREVKETKDES